MITRGAAAVAALLLVTPPAPQPPATGLTAAPALARAYDAIFDARFDAVPGLLREACGPAPAEACTVLDTVALLWRIQLDPRDRSRDAAFERQADAAIEAAEAWTAREPHRAEAWFYLGGAFGARVQWKVLRGERLGAARDGRRIKDALEQALALDPAMHDAHFGLGLYHYYADVAPAVLRVLRWLLLLPGGDRELGLAQMQRARAEGRLLRSEADYQLHQIYLWYEEQPERALALLRELRARHATNPLFLQAIAEVQDVYFDDPAASLASWETLLEEALAGRVAEPAMAASRARAAIDALRLRLERTDAAIDVR